MWELSQTSLTPTKSWGKTARCFSRSRHSKSLLKAVWGQDTQIFSWFWSWTVSKKSFNKNILIKIHRIFSSYTWCKYTFFLDVCPLRIISFTCLFIRQMWSEFSLKTSTVLNTERALLNKDPSLALKNPTSILGNAWQSLCWWMCLDFHLHLLPT